MNFESAYAQAVNEIRKKLDARTSANESEIQKLYDSSQQYRDIVNALSKTGTELGLAAFSGDTEAFDSLQKKAEKLNDAKKAILTASGINSLAYDCDVCKDTGYNNGRLCDCVKRRAVEIMMDGAAGLGVDSSCTFDNFNLDFYPESADNGISARKRMTSIFNYALEYADSFSEQTSENLLFIGNTGLGKTHLSLAIYNSLIKKGFNVSYKTAFNLFSAIENEHFNERKNDTYEECLNVDLLIIDDLGTEFVSPFVKSVLYNIINSRLLSKKPTIINANISLKEIETTYTPRVSSRIFGNYTVKMFLGKDIRQLKKISE